ncbi:SSS family solute:Na+ symporter [Tamaricihabitans halophyticus]|uniref:SSS family solute:Na+ symporter n=1 Tax=Tamaricihabitans halophyticus TaxID=1262583 RepID=A0A4R2QW26_9PSEU|nr:sodium:solute symporter family protein [Tamaricihabitans halophyticus]TCP54300.1 SSS family solute:Na+ symporter [Tamaricihabitans halophyticus]
MQTVHLAMLIGYLAVMLAIGLYFSRASKIRSGEEFLFAGRRLPRIVLIGTLLATWVGSGTVIGGANFAYNYGPLAAMIFFGGTPVGIIILYFAAAKLRKLSNHTIPELLELRFGHGVRMVGAVVILLAYVGITAYQFIGGGYIISLVTPLSAGQATALVAVVVTFLAFSGGLFSVAWTDFLSAVLIVFSLLAAVPIVLVAIGSPAEFIAQLPESSRTLSGGLDFMQLLGYFLPLLLLILADQNLYQRLAAARDAGTARKSTIGFFLASFLITIPVAILAAGASILLPKLADPDAAVLSLASEGVLPAVLGGVLLAGTLAFIVTTATSFMLSVGGNILYDVYIRHTKREVGDAARLRLHRLAVLLVAVLAYGMGQFFPTVLDLQVYSYTVYGVAVTPAVLAVLFWRRVTTFGALASMLLGTVTLLVWEFGLDKPMEWNAVVIALPAALLGLVLGSLLTKPNEERQRKLAEAMR